MDRIVKLIPHIEVPIWSGKRLTANWHKSSPSGVIGEAWEFSVIPTRVSTSEKGTPIDAIFEQNEDFARKTPDLLFKLIDTADDLSVQVHPGDAYAKSHEHSYGKTEAWYVLDCEPDAVIYAGFRRQYSYAEVRRALNEGTILSLLTAFRVQPGDCFFLPSGTIHALGRNVTIAEIQQSSAITYRLYDYNRVGADGKPRQLHLERAMDVIDFVTPYTPHPEPVTLCVTDEVCATQLLYNKYFTMNEVTLNGSATITSTDYCIVTAVADKLRLQDACTDIVLLRGETAMVAANTEFRISATGGCTALICAPQKINVR